MPLRRQKIIKRQDLQSNSDWFYLFGDNEIRVGLGGQAAEMRGEPNAIGVATLRAPGVFWRDDDFKHQRDVIDNDLARVKVLLAAGKTIIIPADGLGTGLAQLAQRSPLTFQYLQRELEALNDLD